MTKDDSVQDLTRFFIALGEVSSNIGTDPKSH